MESFEFYLQKGDVKKVSVNLERARFLIKDGKSRIKDSNLLDKKKFPKIVFENYYDALRDFCDAILIFDGFKSFSHEASIVYLGKKGFDVSVISRLDRFRYKRNGSKYYGEEISVEEAKDIKEFYLEIKDKLIDILKKIENFKTC